MIDPGFIAVIIAGLVGVGLAQLLLPLKRAEIESGLTPTYEVRCAGRGYLGFGFFGGFLSFRISFYDNFFVLGSILRRVIPYSSVNLVEYKELFFSKGIVIHTQDPDARFALFPSHPKQLLELFTGKGVRVTGT